MTISMSPAIAAGTYRIDPSTSEIAFTAKGFFGLETVRGTMRVRDGEIVVAADPAASTVRATVDAASFKTDKARRDTHVTSASFLDAASFPTMTFAGTGAARSADGSWQLVGELTVHGTTAPVPMTIVETSATAAGCRLRATARVDRYAHGITSGRGFIRRYLDVEVDIHATPRL